MTAPNLSNGGPLVRFLHPPVRLGVAPGEPATVSSVAQNIVKGVSGGRGGYACFCNVHLLVEAAQRADVAGALGDARWVLPDGAPVAVAARRAGHDVLRLPGAAVMEEVLRVGRASKLRHVFVGSTDATLARLSTQLAEWIPGVDIAALISPSFSSRIDDLDVSDEIRASGADVIWVGLGAPKQELWMRRYAPELAPAIMLGVGAAFDFLAGTQTRAPDWMQRGGLEWLHRLAKEPRRLGLRYAHTNTRYLAGLGAELIGSRLQRRR